MRVEGVPECIRQQSGKWVRIPRCPLFDPDAPRVGRCDDAGLAVEALHGQTHQPPAARLILTGTAESRTELDENPTWHQTNKQNARS